MIYFDCVQIQVKLFIGKTPQNHLQTLQNYSSLKPYHKTYIMYYLKHEHECFIRYKTRGAAERFISDKARIASVFKNDPFYTHLVTLFTKEFSI